MQGEQVGTHIHWVYPAIPNEEAVAFQKHMQSWDPALALRLHSILICAAGLPPCETGPCLQGVTQKTYMELCALCPWW